MGDTIRNILPGSAVPTLIEQVPGIGDRLAAMRVGIARLERSVKKVGVTS